MIRAAHTLIYSDDPPATRAFLKDVLRLPFVCEPGTGDEGRGFEQVASDDPADWLIFATGPSELGVHPARASTTEPVERPPHARHEIAFVCDDIVATVRELRRRGGDVDGEPRDRGFGIAVMLKVPGADDLLLYEPRHRTAYDLPQGRP